MSHFLRYFCLSAILTSHVFAATTIDFKVINGVFKSIAAQVVKAEQVQDKSGKDMIDRLEVIFDEKTTDISKGSIDFKSGVYLHSSSWTNTPSSLNLDVSTRLNDTRTGRDLTAKATLGIKTDVVALIHFVVAEINKQDLCSDEAIKRSADAHEETFNKEACTDWAKLDKIKTTGEFLDIVQAILEKRETYAATVKDSKETPYLKNAVTTLKARKDKNSVTLKIAEDTEVSGGTKLLSIDYAVSPTATSFGFSLVSSEGALFYESTSKHFEELASTLSLDDADPEKVKTVQDLRDNFRWGVGLAKSVLLQK